MPSTDSQNNCAAPRPRIIAIVLVQIAALLALSGAAVLYLDWSSNAAQAEFMRAIQSASAPSHLSQPSMPIHRVKSPMTCARKV